MAHADWTSTSPEEREGYTLHTKAGEATVRQRGTAGYSARISGGMHAKEAAQLFRTAAEAQAWCEQELRSAQAN